MGRPGTHVGAGVAFSDVGTDDLAFLLGAAVAAPEASADPRAGPLIGSLLAALAGRGADDVVERFLSGGDGAAIFEVRAYRVGSSVPVTRDREVTASRAVQRLLHRGESQGGQELIIQLEDGTEARVMLRVGEGPLVYQFGSAPRTVSALAESQPDPAPTPPIDDLTEALRQVLVDTTIEVDLGGIEEVVARAVANAGSAALSPAPLELDLSGIEAAVARVVANASALPQPSVKLDLGGIETVVARAVANAMPSPASPDLPPWPAPPAEPVASPDDIAAAVEQRMRVVVDNRMNALARLLREHGVDRSEVVLERMWLRTRGMDDQLHATGDAVARIEAAVEEADRQGALRSKRMTDLVQAEVEALAIRRRTDIEELRTQVNRLVEALSRIQEGKGSTGPVPLAIVPGDKSRR